jgi:hypothetical protein
MRPVHNSTERKLRKNIKHNSQNNIILKDKILKKIR